MLQDRFHRLISYLRISVTDRCNFRCVYCMPAHGIDIAPRAELLTFEEIERVARVGAGLGVNKIRLTGGEPTVRRDLPVLVAMLKNIDGINELAMTTNAVLLGDVAASLKEAGLDRVNISIDTLDRAKAFAIARRDDFDKVQRGIQAAHEVGLKIKFNTVAMRGTNDDELADLAEFAASYNAPIRFIEWMPMGEARFDEINQTISAREMRLILNGRFDLQEQPRRAGDPARSWVCQKTGAQIGFISSMTDHFCETCNRMRLTATGGLRPCLHQDAETDVRSILRGGGSDDELRAAYFEAAGLKWAGHRMNDVIPLYSSKDMVAIGG